MRATMIVQALDAITCRVPGRPAPAGPRSGDARRKQAESQHCHPAAAELLWVLFIFTRPLPATVGAFFDKPIAQGSE
jgi:hypothetical protein